MDNMEREVTGAVREWRRAIRVRSTTESVVLAYWRFRASFYSRFSKVPHAMRLVDAIAILDAGFPREALERLAALQTEGASFL